MKHNLLAEITADGDRTAALNDAITTLTASTAKREAAKADIIKALTWPNFGWRHWDWAKEPKEKRGVERDTLKSLAGVMQKAATLVNKLDRYTYFRLVRTSPEWSSLDTEEGGVADFFTLVSEACKEVKEELPNLGGGNPTNIYQHDLAEVCVDLLAKWHHRKRITTANALSLFHSLTIALGEAGDTEGGIGTRACKVAVANWRARKKPRLKVKAAGAAMD